MSFRCGNAARIRRNSARRKRSVQLQRRDPEVAAQLDGLPRATDVGDRDRADERREARHDVPRLGLGEVVVHAAGQAHGEAERIHPGALQLQCLLQARNPCNLYPHRPHHDVLISRQYARDRSRTPAWCASASGQPTRAARAHGDPPVINLPTVRQIRPSVNFLRATRSCCVQSRTPRHGSCSTTATSETEIGDMGIYISRRKTSHSRRLTSPALASSTWW